MAEQQQEQDKTEPASPFKLREAKKRGQVAKSMEVNSFVILSVGLALLYFSGESFIKQQLALSRGLLSNSHRFVAKTGVTMEWFAQIIEAMMHIFWTLFLCVAIAGILANMFQTGPIFSFFPLKPDFKRINPVEGFKRVFSKRLLFEAIKTLVKLTIFSFVLYFAIAALLPKLLALHDIRPEAYPAFLLDGVRSLFFKMLLIVLLIALFDLAYTKWDFAQRMRMSRRELKEEVKRREGDPLIRAKLRELQREAVKRAGTLKRVPDADVLITNPTHLSVALKYERNVMSAPIVIAKGAGELALKMRDVARKRNVVIVENKKLARQLFQKVEIDQGIPEDLFPVIAKILAWIFAKRDAPIVNGVSA